VPFSFYYKPYLGLVVKKTCQMAPYPEFFSIINLIPSQSFLFFSYKFPLNHLEFFIRRSCVLRGCTVRAALCRHLRQSHPLRTAHDRNRAGANSCDQTATHRLTYKPAVQPEPHRLRLVPQEHRRGYGASESSPELAKCWQKSRIGTARAKGKW
jgi:hypothetical protein